MFSINNTETIVPIKDTKGIQIGTGEFLSEWDIYELNMLYGCEGFQRELECFCCSYCVLKV
jgi:hypothetical protein